MAKGLLSLIVTGRCLGIMQGPEGGSVPGQRSGEFQANVIPIPLFREKVWVKTIPQELQNTLARM